MSTHPLPLKARGLAKTFSQRLWWGGRRRSRALERLDLTVQSGEAFGLVGPNGAGKSTTIKLALGLAFPSAGEVHLHDLPPTEARARRGLGYMPENPSLMGHLSTLENLTGAGRLRGLDWRTARRQAGTMLEQVGLAESAGKPLDQLSKGMAQRAALAHALIGNPDFLVLDEPLTGLDPLWRKEVIDLLMAYREEGGTLLFCSHILSDVERLVDRIGILDQGRLRTITTPAELIGRHVATYTVRTRGAHQPKTADAHREGPEQWTMEVDEAGIWPVLEDLRGQGHQIVEIRPSGAGLEGALMQFLEEGRESAEPTG